MKTRWIMILSAWCLIAHPALADTWPAKPIHFIVAAPGGSSLDIIARTIGEKLKDRLGQPVIVENNPGAGGTIATGSVARATADGYTMLLSYNGPLAFTQYLTKLPYDPQKDLIPVILTSSQPSVLAVNANVPAQNLRELVALAKANPGKLNYASVGNGSSSHLTMELFKSMAGLNLVHIPYNGAPPAAFSVVAGETQMVFAVPTVIMPQVKGGKLRALAVTSASRFSLLPELPTMAESGLPGFESMAWNGVLLPASTSSEIVNRLNREIDAILKMPDVKKRLHDAGLAPVGGTPQAFRSVIASESVKWGAIIRAIGARLD